MIYIIIFLIAILTAFGVLHYRVWQLQNVNVNIPMEQPVSGHSQIISFRKLEKGALILLKRFLQKIVLIIAEGWFLLTTKTKKFLMEKWPKVHDIFVKKDPSLIEPKQPSFFARALLESKYKIKRLKKKIHDDHDMPE